MNFDDNYDSNGYCPNCDSDCEGEEHPVDEMHIVWRCEHCKHVLPGQRLELNDYWWQVQRYLLQDSDWYETPHLPAYEA